MATNKPQWSYETFYKQKIIQRTADLSLKMASITDMQLFPCENFNVLIRASSNLHQLFDSLFDVRSSRFGLNSTLIPASGLNKIKWNFLVINMIHLNCVTTLSVMPSQNLFSYISSDIVWLLQLNLVAEMKLNFTHLFISSSDFLWRYYSGFMYNSI